MSLLAIEIGGTKLQLALGDSSGRITRRWRHQVQPAEGGAGIRRQIESTLPEIFAEGSVKAIGVGFGGPVDTATGRICCSHQIEGWSEFPIGEWLFSLTKRPVRVDNDANVAALGEALCGAGQGIAQVFYVTMGSGVGGGMVVDGRIYHGAIPGEAEIGHLRLDKSGVIVEERCSGWAVDRKIMAGVASTPTSILATLTKGMERGQARHLSTALACGDALAVQILKETSDDIAFALSHVTHLFHPGIIVLGGGLSLVGEPLRAAVEAALPAYVMEAFHPAPKITLAGLGEDAVPVGALKLASL